MLRYTYISCLVYFIKCSGSFGSHIICFFLYPSIDCISVSWVHSIFTTPLFTKGWWGMKTMDRSRRWCAWHGAPCTVHTCSSHNRIISLMRRQNTDIAPNKPVTLPHNQLLIRYVVMLKGSQRSETPNLPWQKATPLIVGWFLGRTWKNNSKWHTAWIIV